MILGVTPIREGSKELAGKNIKPLAGKPLLAWTIESAKNATLLNRYIVSTESCTIANVARNFGAEVLNRPRDLAEDQTPTWAVLQHVLGEIPADLVVLLQATSPIRNAGLIDSCVRQFLDSKVDSLATGWQCKYRPYGSPMLNRQEIEGFFYDDGNLYIFKKEHIMAGQPYGKNFKLVMLDKEQNIDIDDEFDFWLADQVMAKRLQKVASHA